jgi:hypothetical protein
MRFPGLGGRDRQGGEGRRDQHQVDDRLRARPEMPAHEMGVRIAAQQQHLEEKHAGRPDAGTAAEPGQDVLADQGLDLE